ncbi:MAG: cell division protein FtsA [Pontiellaceae bacterium]
MAGDVTAVLEIGTSKVRCLIGEVREDQSISVVGYGEVESQGIRKGEILNRDKAIIAVRKALKTAEENTRKTIHSVVLVLSGGDASCVISEGVHRIADASENRKQEIMAEDIAEVLSIARRHVLPDNRIRLHSLESYFTVDDIQEVTDPKGLSCEVLKVQVLTLHGKRSVVENFQKLVVDIPVVCADAVYNGICTSWAVTNKSMRKAGVLVIDLGGGTTDFALYHNGILQHCGSFTAGGSHVTNDIAKGLQIPEAQAEALKNKEGSALSNLMERDRNISIPSDTHGFNGKMVRAVTLNTIIQARMEEIFELVKEDVEGFLLNKPLGAGVLLTGGGAFLDGTRDLGQKIFNAPCSIGKPIDVHGLPSQQSAPYYAPLIGAIRYVSSLEKKVENPSHFKRLLQHLWGQQNGK